jgi:hypothetical protein
MAKIQQAAIPQLRSQIDAVTSDPEGAPGISFCAVNKNGEVIFEHASGKLGVGRDEACTLDTVFWIASCTKMITGIACMQLVEKGVLELDSVELVEKLSPVSFDDWWCVEHGVFDRPSGCVIEIWCDGCCYVWTREVAFADNLSIAGAKSSASAAARRTARAQGTRHHAAHAAYPYW